MKVVYIAGPFDGATVWKTEINIREAESLALAVWKLGFAAICPHLNTRYFTGELPRETWLKGDLAILANCDALLTTFRWEGSAGARGEVDFALTKGIKVFHSTYDLEEWKENGYV